MASKTKKIGHVADQWHVRDENGGIFGPVTLHALKSWVEDGRVSPASEVSSMDGRWELAVRVPELAMNCVAEIEPGSFYGPIHRKAMQGLIESGSIPGEATIYCKQCVQDEGTPLPPVDGVSQFEHDAVRAQLAALTSEVVASQAELAVLRAQRSAEDAERQGSQEELAELTDSLQSERASVQKLSNTAAALQEELRSLQAKRDADLVQLEVLHTQSMEQAALASALQEELQMQRFEQSVSQKKWAEQVSALEEDLQGQRAEQSAMQGALEQMVRVQQREITTLNGSLAELQLKIVAVSSERESFAAEVEALRKDNQDQMKRFKQCEQSHLAELREKASACALQIAAAAREREREDEGMTAKNFQIAALLQRLEELELANKELKEEFEHYEGLQNNGAANDAAQRKLVLIKNIIAEAARVLEGVESCVEESPIEILDTGLSAATEGDLLEYEELSVEEFMIGKEKTPAVEESHPGNKSQPAPTQNIKPSKSKVSKKWPFGSATKNLGHDSLAELEAQAQIELQRLSSSQNLASLFDRKK